MTTQPSKRKLWCEFKGFGQWDCDDAPCENGAAFRVVGGNGSAVHEVCVRHLGYAAAWELQGHAALRVEPSEV